MLIFRMALNVQCLFNRPAVSSVREMNVEDRTFHIGVYRPKHDDRDQSMDDVDYAVVTDDARLLVVVNGVPRNVPYELIRQAYEKIVAEDVHKEINADHERHELNADDNQIDEIDESEEIEQDDADHERRELNADDNQIDEIDESEEIEQDDADDEMEASNDDMGNDDMGYEDSDTPDEFCSPPTKRT